MILNSCSEPHDDAMHFWKTIDGNVAETAPTNEGNPIFSVCQSSGEGFLRNMLNFGCEVNFPLNMKMKRKIPGTN